ncbi:hypothetical protein KEM48_013970 [Puccinia striiformis f. sp. tritici PST-130]|nr:hypothetical protein KEM48_013970 [Puccinia striiformis f. sp. tritici PST-130]
MAQCSDSPMELGQASLKDSLRGQLTHLQINTVDDFFGRVHNGKLDHALSHQPASNQLPSHMAYSIKQKSRPI